MQAKHNAWLWMLLFAAPYFINLGASSIWDINEAFYVEAPREMMEARDWLTPRFNHGFRLEKPILSYWVILPFYYWLGAGEFAERLPIAIAMVLTMILVYRLGCALFDSAAGLFGALVMATSFKVFWLARRSIIDILLLLCVTAAIYFAVQALREDHRRRLNADLFYAAMALGTLAKGLLGVILPAGIMLLYLLSRRELPAIRSLYPLRGAVVYSLLCAPWYGAMLFIHGWSYFQFFFGGNHVDRYLYGTYGIIRPIWYYIPTFLGGFLPWSIFLAPTLVFAGRAFGKGQEADRSSLTLVAVWFSFIFIFFSLARSKQEEYILQLYPAGALAVGYFFSRLRARGDALQNGRPTAKNDGWLMVSTVLAVALFGLASILYFFTAEKLFGTRYFFNWVPALGWSTAAALLVCMLVLQRPRAVFPITAGASLFFLLCISAVVLPDCERYRPVKALAEKIRAEARPNDAIGSYGIALPSLCFYTRRPVFEVRSPDSIDAQLCQSRRVFCLMEESEYRTLAKTSRCSLYVWESRPKLTTSLKGFLTFWKSGQLPHLMLVSNHPARSD